MKTGDTVHIFMPIENSYEELGKGFFVERSVDIFGDAWLIRRFHGGGLSFVVLPFNTYSILATTRLVLTEKNIYRKR